MPIVNHLKNADAQRKVLAVASGVHVVEGHLIYSYAVGSSPTHNIYLRQALGEGTWKGARRIFFKGLDIPAADFHFLNGLQTATTSWFDTDVPHFRTVICDVKCPTGIGAVNTEETPPTDFRGIFECELFPDFDEDGNQIDPDDGTPVVLFEDLLDGSAILDEDYFTYTVNPARVAVGWMFKYGNTTVDDINWTVWAAFRDFHDQTELVDYTVLPEFEGFGLSGSFYNGTNFNTLLSKRIDPVIDFPNSSKAPMFGQTVGSFSARWEGKIRPLYSETYTFKITHDNGARLWVNGVAILDHATTWDNTGTITPGTHTGTIVLAADAFYDIKVEWNDGGSPNEFRLKWSSASQTEEIIPPEVLYPLPQEQALYEAHVQFSTPTDIDTMIDRVLLVSNSLRQDVDGKTEFYCIEQLSNSFHFQEDLLEHERQIMRDKDGRDIFSFTRTDRRATDLQNVWEAKIKDLDSQYLEEPFNPLIIEIPELIAAAGRKIYGSPIDLGNMTRWQARKVLMYIVGRTVLADTTINLNGTARTYQVICNDLAQVTHSLGNFDMKQFIVLEATDNSPEETAETRIFKLQEWLTLEEIADRLGLAIVIDEKID